MTKYNDKNFKSRIHHFVIYPNEDITHKKALEYVIKNYSHAFINHDYDVYDKDVLDDDGNVIHAIGEIKKNHTHLIVKLPNARHRDAFCKQLGIASNYDLYDTLQNGLLYLIHYNDIDKYQYNLDEVQGNLKQWLVEFLNKKYNTEEQNMLDLLLYIDNQKYISYTNLMKWACSNGYWSVMRRGGQFICKYIDEHNSMINTFGLNHLEINKEAFDTIKKTYQNDVTKIKDIFGEQIEIKFID